MSLINEALKKAQRQRADDAAEPTTTGGPHPRRGKARGANTLLLGAGALVLVVLSVVATVFLVNRPSAPAPQPTPPVVATPTADSIPTPTVSLSLPPPPPPSAPVEPPSSAKPTPVETPATPVATAATASPAPAPVAAAPTPPPEPEPAFDERVAAFVDSVRVTGIRSFGAESRVLMNERVYRVNDVVERTLGVRLTAVAADSLTFTDAKGRTYVKNF